MEKNTLDLIRTDLKYKRDALHLSHQLLKQEGDFYQKVIIFTSLASGIFESVKMKLQLRQPSLELLPIILTSFVCGISSYVKFKQYAERQEVLIQSTTILTNTLNQVRNADELTEEITHAYNHSLELLEISLYPDIRRRFLKISQRNMEAIIKNENCYFDNIERVRLGLKLKKCDSDNNVIDLIDTPPQSEKKVLERINETEEFNEL
tara:strand:+ start:506 stop:1126 length:621 start_codon:yes stop_codon:yes gene_type:complete